MSTLSEFFAFYGDGISRFLHWFTVPVNLFGLFVCGFPVVSCFGFLFYCLTEDSDSEIGRFWNFWFVLFLCGLFVFFFFGIPFLLYLDK